jgi:DNA mismatch endonuclease (patch repair protein)
MLGNRSRDTRPEKALRSAVHQLGLRYRVAARPLPGLRRTADLVFRPAAVAVFLDGCFWHGCPVHSNTVRTNPDYWTSKIERNRRRDEDTDRALTAAGWRSIRVWEHQDPRLAAEHIARVVEIRRPDR